MASPHVTDEEIRQFCRRQLPGDALVRFADHLAGCDECRDRVNRAGNPAAAMSTLQDSLGIGEDDHIGEDDIQLFVDGGLDDERRAAIRAHLAECHSCAEEVRDLHEFAAASQQRAPSRWTYAALATAALLVVAAGAGAFWREKTAPSATLARSGAASAPATEDAAVVHDALASARLSLPPVLSALQEHRGVVLGDAAAPAFSLLSPVGTVVLDRRPTLRWTALPDSTTYTVTLQDQATGATINSPPVHGTEWRPDAPLAQGRMYAWQVGVSRGATEIVAPRPPDPPARFTVADAATAAHLERLPASPLARGVLYAHAGLLDDAERELEAARAQGEEGDRVEAFLAQLRRARSAGASRPR